MGRLYSASFSKVAVSAAQDLFEVTAPADAVVLVHQLELSQSTETGDAAEESLPVLLKSGATVSGSGGSSPTVVPIAFGDPAFGGVVDANNTTKANTGTIVTHQAWDWNVRADFIRIWTPETRPLLSPSRRLTVELVDAPADSITMSGSIIFEEIGG